MNIWRMAFRAGNGGPEMWPECLLWGVAAITYEPVMKTNLSLYPPGEPKDLWSRLSPPQKYSLRQVVYEMKKGDIIFAKQGSKIVGKGIVKGPYKFDSKFRIIDPNGNPWSHQVPVRWLANFTEVKAVIGDQQRYTVRKLAGEDFRKFEKSAKVSIKLDATEGQIYKKEANFRRRNGALIQAKKSNSDYRCEVCGFNFEKAYGSLGHDYIIAHHIEPLSGRTRPSITTLNDIALLCANCHAMVHIINPPLSLDKLQKLLRLKSK